MDLGHNAFKFGLYQLNREQELLSYCLVHCHKTTNQYKGDLSCDGFRLYIMKMDELYIHCALLQKEN